MRKVFISAIVIFCAVALAEYGYCGCGCRNNCQAATPDADSYDDCAGSPMKKLGRGLANCITFPLEVPYRMGKVNVTDGPFASCTYGLLKGLGMAGLRAGAGIYEIVTFPMPCPADYAPVLTDPEYMFEDQLW